MSEQLELFDLDTPSDLDSPIIPYWQTTDEDSVKLYLGNALQVLQRLPANSVHCVVTSPPYWGLRDYGVEGQLGSEETPQEYVANMVKVFREIRRVLRDDGTCWLNIGDSYNQQQGKGFATNKNKPSYNPETDKRSNMLERDLKISSNCNTGLPNGNLVGIPWMLAFALRDDGWILRQDIIWHKTNPMPESTENRCTKAHEYLFLLTKQTDYFYDGEAIKEVSTTKPHAPGNRKVAPERNDKGHLNEKERTFSADGMSNKRSVWSIPSQSYKGAHYATFPVRLITPCILAGTSEKGCCGICGSPWERVVETRGGPPNMRFKNGLAGNCKTAHSEGTVAGSALSRLYAKYGYPKKETIGWQPTCACNGYFRTTKVAVKVVRRVDDEDKHDRDHSQRQNRHGKGSTSLDKNVETKIVIKQQNVTKYYPRIPLDDHPVVPCTVLDPFIGSGTTCEVSLAHRRRSIGIDLSREYLAYNAIPRIEGYLRSVGELAHLAHKSETSTISFD